MFDRIRCANRSDVRLVLPAHCFHLGQFIEKPKSPSQILVEKVESRSVFLRWTVGNTGRAPIIKYIIEYNNESNFRPETATWKTAHVVNDAHKLYPLFPMEVPNLKPYAEYRFRVTAVNLMGSSAPSNASGTVRTAEDSKCFCFLKLG